MPRLRPVDGKELIKILCNRFGFVKVRQKGSHVTLQRNGTFVTVPMKEIRVGLLTRILRDCDISRDDFLAYL
jgi:predicted RNA binding protein YcfA (HicA-like mRNA interferase family)